MKRDIVIVGAGFGGIEAAKILCKTKDKLANFRIVLIDKKETSDFLPILPDVVGGRIEPKNARVHIKKYVAHWGIEFVNDKVESIELNEKKIRLDSGKVVDYDYLILAVGSETNFYDKEMWRDFVYTIDNLTDAIRLRDDLKENPNRPVLVIGGGYTGIEIATNIAMLFSNLKIPAHTINIVEVAKSILGPLPEWMKLYVKMNLDALEIGVLTGVSLENYDEKRAVLSNGMTFDSPFVVWTPGVKASRTVSRLGVPGDRQDRIIVDKFLRFHEKTYALGDCASFNQQGRPLRMAVQFSVFQARTVARNIIGEVTGKQQKEYSPRDLGYLVPMANAKACGILGTLKVKGIIAWWMHYIMSIYRSLRFKNKVGIIKNLIFKTHLSTS